MRSTYKPLYGLVLELISRFKDRCMHLLHSVSELDSKPAENIALPGVVFGVNTCLNLLVVDHAYAKRALRLRCVERRARLLDLREQLLPKRK